MIRIPKLRMPKLRIPIKGIILPLSQRLFDIAVAFVRQLVLLPFVVSNRIIDQIQAHRRQRLSTVDVPEAESARNPQPEPRVLSESEVRDFLFVQWNPTELRNH
jgi:hypothetical protein